MVRQERERVLGRSIAGFVIGAVVVGALAFTAGTGETVFGLSIIGAGLLPPLLVGGAVFALYRPKPKVGPGASPAAVERARRAASSRRIAFALVAGLLTVFALVAGVCIVFVIALNTWANTK